ncbi:MAG: D-hexose-6-phosphate mutarotase [Steroidobacteraceae bacterium]
MTTTLHHPNGSSAQIHEYGAHITSWCTTDGMERLFLSQRAEFREGAAIRGGVPIIFPQFAGLGHLPKHGLARTANWQRVSVPNELADSALFRWQDNEATYAIWPQQFVAEYKVSLGVDSLSMQLSIRNTGKHSFIFTAALHTYLRVRHIAQISISGLQDLRYSDSAVGGMDSFDSASSLRVEGELDRIYYSTVQPIKVFERGHRTLVCRADGFADTVVWNPGAEKAATLLDLEPDGYRHMLCVEAAAIGAPIVLQPLASWSGTQYLQVE